MSRGTTTSARWTSPCRARSGRIDRRTSDPTRGSHRWSWADSGKTRRSLDSLTRPLRRDVRNIIEASRTISEKDAGKWKQWKAPAVDDSFSGRWQTSLSSSISLVNGSPECSWWMSDQWISWLSVWYYEMKT
jgi:hypothetical protein